MNKTAVEEKVEKNSKEEVKDLIIKKNSYKDKLVWIDIRKKNNTDYFNDFAFINLDVHENIGFIINDEQLELIPQSMKKIKYVKGIPDNIQLLCEKYDIIILEHQVILSDWYLKNKDKFTTKVAAEVNVIDPSTLHMAVKMTHLVSLIIISFKDETKIPLEIVLADAQNFNCKVVVEAKDNEEAKVIFGVLEFGADGVILKDNNLQNIYSVIDEIKSKSEFLDNGLKELTVLRTFYAGMGDRACLDMTSFLELDEGVLIGSFSNGGLLACSETHPLPYMKTRPFRINAGSLQSYVLAPGNQTWYLSDLRAGMEVLAVNTKGKTRSVTVGRVKIERRPMMCIEAQDDDKTIVNVFMQADWHVRVFGKNGEPINITTIKPGDKLLGYTMKSGRHVGVNVDELIIEQ